jgi:hypothetical protein
MPKHKIFFNGWMFESKAHAINVIRRILHGTELKSRVKGTQDHQFLMDLFACHPNYSSKLSGRTVSHFETHHNKGGSICFHAAFVEGGSVHFSYKKCLDAIVMRAEPSDSEVQFLILEKLSD